VSNILSHPHSVFINVVGFAEAADEAGAIPKTRIVEEK
jgi:hypothetical protein